MLNAPFLGSTCNKIFRHLCILFSMNLLVTLPVIVKKKTALGQTGPVGGVRELIMGILARDSQCIGLSFVGYLVGFPVHGSRSKSWFFWVVWTHCFFRTWARVSFLFWPDFIYWLTAALDCTGNVVLYFIKNSRLLLLMKNSSNYIHNVLKFLVSFQSMSYFIHVLKVSDRVGSIWISVALL